MEIKARYLQACILLISVSTAVGFYLIADYYMNPSTSDAFGGSCNEVVEDASLYINSHINPLRWFSYGGNKDCVMTMDAGSMGGALYKIDWMYFDLENSAGCTKDYLKFYDSNIANMGPANLLGSYCGTYVNFTGPTQRYLTLEFHTDGSGSGDGFRFRGLRYEPPPCQSDEFHCTLEDICIDDRLKCDGTRHCVDNLDESDCSFFEKLIGSIIALGLGGIVAVSIAFIAGCVGLWTLVCVFTCCKKCCSVCCTKCCCFWPCCKGKSCGKAGRGKVEPDQESIVGSDLPEKTNDNDVKIEEGEDFFDDEKKSNVVNVAPEGEGTNNANSANGRNTQMSSVGYQNDAYMADVGH